jgi:hypothetical protein
MEKASPMPPAASQTHWTVKELFCLRRTLLSKKNYIVFRQPVVERQNSSFRLDEKSK